MSDVLGSQSPGNSDSGDGSLDEASPEGREVLERELLQVMRELERREFHLTQVESRLGESERVLQEINQEHMIRVGEVVALQQAEARRKSLTKEVAQLKRTLAEAREDVRRARERRREIESDLNALV